MSVYRNPRILLLVCGIALGAVTSCGGEEPPSALGFVDDAPIVLAPDSSEISLENQRLVSFHADWLCELQRRTFTDLDDAGDALTVALEAADIGSSDYEMFTTEALPTPTIRDAVRFAYQEECSVK